MSTATASCVGDLPKAWESPVRHILRALGYTQKETESILEHARQHNTFECAPVVAECHTLVCEEYLDDDAPGNWARPEYAGTWSASA